MPNYFLDDQLGTITPNAFVVLTYICRRTLGFNRLSAEIPLNQFLKGNIAADGRQLDKGAGIHNKNALVAALSELREKGLISFTSIRGQVTEYTVILPEASTDLILADEKASTTVDTSQVSTSILAYKGTHPSGRPKHVSRKKEKEIKKNSRSTTGPIDFSKFEPGGKYHRFVQH